MWGESQLKIKNTCTKSKAAPLASTCNVSDPCLQNADVLHSVNIMRRLQFQSKENCTIWEEADMNYFASFGKKQT